MLSATCCWTNRGDYPIPIYMIPFYIHIHTRCNRNLKTPLLLFKNLRSKLTVAKEMVAGGAAGLCQTVITTPMELLKIQLQLSAQQNAGRKASALLLASQLISTQGENSYLSFIFLLLSQF